MPRSVPTCEATGVVRAGKFFVDDKRGLVERIARLPEGPAILRIEPAGQARTLEDNRRYWAILGAVAEQTGHAANELHEHYKDKFIGGRSTTALDEAHFRTYVATVMADAAIEHGVEFPGPEPLVEAAR